MTTNHLVGIVIAALGGAAVGLERQWSGRAEGPDARFAGIRTFTMLGAQTVSPAVAAAAIALGVLSNTAMKIALAVAFGSRRFKVITGLALALILIALAAALAVRWLR
jgi:uncharacterized membrane protein (DUF4010 family)